MWLWEAEFRRLGFRRRSERYWRCDRRYGLGADGHLSVFSWGELAGPGGLLLAELTEFHVTFRLGLDHIHFYYHEYRDNEWHPGGRTSGREIRRLGEDPRALRRRADAVAAALAEALGGLLRPREPPGRARRA
jgi:hypothetical protein